MATLNITTVNAFLLHLAKGLHDFTPSTGDTFSLRKSNTTPDASWTTPSQITELSTSGGYTAGGEELTIGSCATADTNALEVTSSNNPTNTGSGAGYTYRYLWIVNDTATLLVGYADLGAEKTVAADEPDPVFATGTRVFRLQPSA